MRAPYRGSPGEGVGVTSSVQVVVEEAGADSERVDALARTLRAELLALDVDDVQPVSSGAAPPGARAVDALAVGALLVDLSQSAGLVAVIGAVRAWLSRGS